MKPRPFHDLLFDYGCALMQQEVSVNRLWKLGIQVGGSTVIVDVLTFSLRFAKVTPQPKTTGENGAAISTK